jgi:2-methylcitrate dehydratase PrpD
MATGITAEVADWAATLRSSDLPEPVRDRARLQTASVLGAVFVGARSGLGERIRAAAARWAGPPEATIIPTGPRTSIHTACYVNAASSVAFDFDDYLFAGHTGHSSVLGALAFGEALSSTGDDALVAQVVGNEVGGRLGAAMLFGPHNGQMWAYIHALAGACVAGRFLGLDPERMGNAIGLALAQPPYPLAPAFFGPDSKALLASGPLVDGIRAAELAHAGLTGADDILGDPAGVVGKLSDRPLDFAFTGLGSAWVTESLTYKLYPGCAYIDTPVDAFKQILGDFAAKHGRPAGPADVGSIRVEATLFTWGMEMMSAPYRSRVRLRPVDVNFSVALSFGLLVCSGDVSASTLEPAALAASREDILAVADAVTVEQDAALTAQTGGLRDVGIDVPRFLAANKGKLGRLGDLLAEQSGAEPAEGDDYSPTLEGASFGAFEMRFPARVTLLTKEGDEFQAEAHVPLGGAGRDWAETVEGVRRKFVENAGHLGERAPAAFEAVRGIDRAPDVAGIIEAVTRGR